MPHSNILRTLTRKLKNEGFHHTLQGIYIKLMRALFLWKDIIYYNDIANYVLKMEMPDNYKIEHITSAEEISEKDFQRLATYRDEKVINCQFEERFGHGAEFWLLKVDNQIVSFFWSIKAAPIEHYFFPLTDKDAFYFDGATFPEFRGKRILSNFSHFLTLEFQKRGIQRGFFSVHKWNKPIINAAKRMPFTKFGTATKMHLFGCDFVIWYYMANRNEKKKNKSLE